MNIEPNSAREDRVKNLAKMLLKSRSNTMNELVLRTNKLQKIVDRKKVSYSTDCLHLLLVT